MFAGVSVRQSNLVIYCQTPYSVGTRFLRQNEQITLRPKLGRLGEIFYFATKLHRLQNFHLSNAAKYVNKWAGY